MVLIQNIYISQKEKNLENVAKALNKFQKGMISIAPIEKRHKLKLEVNAKGPCSWTWKDNSIMLTQNENRYSLIENINNKKTFKGSFRTNPNSWGITEIENENFMGRGIYAELEGNDKGKVKIYSY